ncbi:MAG: class I SAM-dependent rRNA methyltransferase [Planctomycetes bacterium]|nr:class I SAM-dependent rRNA methyltransferase [Planctomycetota bacterium]
MKDSKPALPPESRTWPRPWVLLRSAAFHPYIYKRMVRAASTDAAPGALVAVYDKSGQRFGSGFFNPRSQIALRMVAFDDQVVDAGFFRKALEAAVSWRRQVLRLDEAADTYRVVHSEGDGLSGLVVDRFADVLAVEAHSLGIYRRLPEWLPVLAELCGTRRHLVAADPEIARVEGFAPDARLAGEPPRSVRIQENGLRFAVDFQSGHKTGFFCDQRENRKRLAGLVEGRSVLDLCCYTGGFAVYAAALGRAAEVTGVDLDEKAVDQARHNAGLNHVQGRWVHADAFSYARQMQANRNRWDAVVLDPPKFIASRGESAEGRKKYFDLNKLAVALVAPGGLFVTCSCSGLLSQEDFERLVIEAAHRLRRRLQIFNLTGAGPDHPVMSNCLESRYLKVLWARVF